MASVTHTDFVPIPEQIHSDPDVPELSVPELYVLEQTVPEQQVPEQDIINQSPTTNIFVERATSTNDQPSSSNQALQACALPKTTNVPSPPTLFLDSSILADVCENIFQDLNKLILARNNLVHEDNYVKQWRRLKERVDYVLTELQRSSLDAQETTQNNLQDWLRGVVIKEQEVEVSTRTLVRTPLCLEARIATDGIPFVVHPKELDLTWLNKINFKSASTELELIQKNTLLERENRQLKKELLEQKLLLLEYKSFT